MSSESSISITPYCLKIVLHASSSPVRTAVGFFTAACPVGLLPTFRTATGTFRSPANLNISLEPCPIRKPFHVEYQQSDLRSAAKYHPKINEIQIRLVPGGDYISEADTASAAMAKEANPKAPLWERYATLQGRLSLSREAEKINGTESAKLTSP
jgi:hypothetical protein